MNKKFMVPIAVVAIAGAAIFGATAASAHGFGVAGQNQAMIATFAQKLGVSEDKVKEAFDAVHEEHMQQMQVKLEEMLTQAVSSGKITEEQKQLIFAKHNELKAQREQNREAFQNMTPEERKAAMQKQHEELKAWADENGIDLSFFHGFKQGIRMGRHMW